ncbi:MAG TPA: TIGR03936 family radical SAM-associated protein [bacterium]|nr:TIGR03936 family radical SAM-associated protein [bacterium]HPJ72332.1 TIGR03936 family radical SAM-associated protein [bacterium]HPQ66242.1 TIGR03936 family radical SAM-associated protein [bacterium]
MRLRLIYSREGLIRFTSHRDTLRIFFRAFSRSRVPVCFSGGFNPHPRVEFCPPLSLGMEGRAEEMDLRLESPVDPAVAVEAINLYLPQGLRAVSGRLLAEGCPKLGKELEGGIYLLFPEGPAAPEPGAVERFLGAERAPYVRKKPDGDKTIDARRGVARVELAGGNDDIRMEMEILFAGGPRPVEVLSLLTGIPPGELAGVRIVRTGFRRKPAAAVAAPAKEEGYEETDID